MMNNITKFLESQNDFENDQINFLFHNLFSEIKKIARVQLNKFPISHDMSPTVLVNECYLKLITAKSLSLNNTKHFYCIISQCMRYYLVDLIRKQYQTKYKKTDAEIDDDTLKDKRMSIEKIFALDYAINQLSRIDKQLTEIVQLRFFGGFTIQETGVILGVDNNRVFKQWKIAQSVLLEIIEDYE